MAKDSFSKIKILKLWEILNQESDEDNPLTTTQLIEKLQLHGISCDRRTLYTDIKTLNENGYEVLTVRDQYTNKYYVVDRSFDLPELRILMDAVQAASFITKKKTKELADKIANLAGSYKSELIKKNITEFNTTKHKNETIYYNIDEIENAIINRKKVSFRYFDYDIRGERVYRKDGERYLVNPLSTVFSNDNYYLVAFHDKHKNFASYRVDRMSDVITESENVTELKSMQNEDVVEHRKKSFMMYTGELRRVKFEVSNSLIDTIFDRFGEDTHLVDNKNGTFGFETEIEMSSMFVSWCCCFGDRLKVIYPKDIIDEIKKYITVLGENY